MHRTANRPGRRRIIRELNTRRRAASAETTIYCQLSFREPTLSGVWGTPCPRCGQEHDSEITWQDVEWQ